MSGFRMVCTLSYLGYWGFLASLENAREKGQQGEDNVRAFYELAVGVVCKAVEGILLVLVLNPF